LQTEEAKHQADQLLLGSKIESFLPNRELEDLFLTRQGQQITLPEKKKPAWHVLFGEKKNGAIYRLTDEYSLFYLKWIEGKGIAGKNEFLNTETSAWRAWSGYALEALAFKHVEQIQNALKIGGLQVSAHSWIHRKTDTWPEVAQIDLLINRPDNSINILEIKFSNTPYAITKSDAKNLRHKLGTFRGVTKTRKNLFLTFLTTHGLTDNPLSKELVDHEITTDQLFQQNH
jgi:hypothetical protein